MSLNVHLVMLAFEQEPSPSNPTPNKSTFRLTFPALLTSKPKTQTLNPKP